MIKKFKPPGAASSSQSSTRIWQKVPQTSVATKKIFVRKSAAHLIRAIHFWQYDKTDLKVNKFMKI